MRYDGPRDGIEYVTLATVGGGQQGTAAEAGFLHQYHVITVRPQQIAMACLPVGDLMDVREITGEISEEVSRLARHAPTFLSRPTINVDGPSKDPLVIELFNPTSRPVEYEVTMDPVNRQWSSQPDHVHATVYPGQRYTAPFRLQRSNVENRRELSAAGTDPPHGLPGGIRADWLEGETIDRTGRHRTADAGRTRARIGRLG